MNAENYVKAFQGVMGVYGLQFLLVPKKIVRFLCRLPLSLLRYRWECFLKIYSILCRESGRESVDRIIKERNTLLPLERARANWKRLTFVSLTFSLSFSLSLYNKFVYSNSTRTTLTRRRKFITNLFLVERLTPLLRYFLSLCLARVTWHLSHSLSLSLSLSISHAHTQHTND